MVGPGTYISERCWFDADGNFEGFLVLAREGDLAVPWPISGRCLREEGGVALDVLTLGELGRVEVLDKHRTLQRAFETSVNDRAVDHLPGPTLESRVYYFRARVTALPVPGGPAYAPQEVLQLEDTNLAFGRFLELNADERKALWRARPS